MILGTHLFRFGKQIAVLFIRKLHTSIDELARGLHQVRMPLGLCLTPYRQNVVVEQRLDVLDVPRFYLGVPQPVFRGRPLIRRRAPGAKATSDFRHPYFPFTVTNDIPFSSLLGFFFHTCTPAALLIGALTGGLRAYAISFSRKFNFFLHDFIF